MSLVNDDGSSAMEASESIQESEKKQRISYTRDFLLSLSELEICKSLPSGFDQSVLSEFEDNSVQERPRSHGNLPLQGFRRNDYSSSPPTRGDSSNFSRGVYGRWDNRASGWSDKDGDSQSDLDPDSGRRNHGNNQSRRPWQNSEHDGLLGSGSFPRPSGFAPGTSAPKSQSNDHYHLNRSNEAYQPPRPFKAIPHARTNTHDSFNDETFGSSDIASQDRAEEERKRRASFELMRKEQQKVLQEKQKSSGNKLKSDAFSELILEESKEEGVLEASGGELNSVVQSFPNEDSGKLYSVLQSSKPRPLVPPGFRSTILEKSSTTKAISSMEKENPKPGIEEIHLIGKGNHTQNGTLDNIQSQIHSLHKLDITEQGEPNEKLGVGDHHSHRISGFPQLHEAVDGEVFQLNKILSNSSQETSTSILGKFFGSSTSPAVKDGGPTGFLEQQKTKPDDPLSPRNVQSSRFAQWFNEEEKKPVDDHLSSTRPNDLLSLIVGGDKSASQVPNIISPDPPIAPFGVITKTPSDSNQLYNNYRHESAAPPVVAPVLTCEDLEQTILSEYTEKTSSALPPPVPDWAVSSQDNTNAIPVDNHATNHLLSLLQKGTSTTIDDEMKSSENQIHPPSEKPKDEGNPGQNLSLESLFGTAFMKELQSAQAPVSAQRGMGSARIDMFEQNELSMNGLLSSSVDGMGNYESNPNPLSSKQKQPVKSDDPESWLKFNGPRVDPDPLEFRIPKAKIGEIDLPEEESLISVGDPNTTRDPFGISEKLAALNSGFLRGPHDMFEQESRQFNNNNLHVHGQGPSPQMHAAAQMNQNINRRPMFHPLDINSQMRFPEHLMQRGTPPALNQQFQPPFHHHPDTRVTGFDVNPGHHQHQHQHQQMLPPQMRMQQGNFPPPHLMRDVPRPFMGDREAAAIAAMHGFPFGQQSNIGGLGMPLPGVGDGNHPEVFQRMMEMELRAQSKQQIRPLPLNNNQGGGQGLDMGGFRYR